MTDVRKGMPPVALDEAEFKRRFRTQFVDPAYDRVAVELDRIADVAWDAYSHHRKAPRTEKAGSGFADPDYDLSVEWRETRDAIAQAEARQRDPNSPIHVVVVSGGARNEHTCPGEMSKTSRLAQAAVAALKDRDVVVDELDLSILTAEYGRKIYPCKGCLSTAMPLCHWPCSCYPNHALGQTQDFMAELYPRFARAHGIAIITPVYWHQSPSPLKLMIDRLVCADGGNPDPTTTHGKTPAEAKKLERDWPYPQHLAGRVFSVITHGDTEGTANLRSTLTDTLSEMGLVPAGTPALLDRYIGYYQPYATSHKDLDRDEALPVEVKHAMITLVERIVQLRAGTAVPGVDLKPPRRK